MVFYLGLGYLVLYDCLQFYVLRGIAILLHTEIHLKFSFLLGWQRIIMHMYPSTADQFLTRDVIYVKYTMLFRV